MIDIHSHIIYGVDDGARDENETIEMLKMAKASGVNKIVATPHFVRGVFDNYYDIIKNKVNEIQKLAKKNKIDIEVYCGQEVHYHENIFTYYKEGKIGTINDTRYMLIELSMGDFDLDEVVYNLYELRLKGIVPIIAHPERYRKFIKNPELINVLIKEECLFQLNADSLTGYFGRKEKKLAIKYYEAGIYSFIGSDGHRSKGRTTDISDVLKIIEKDKKDIFYNNAERLLKDEKINFIGSYIKEKNKILALFR